MTTFGPLATVLAENPRPINVFFRDDDAGWADQRLQQLCEFFIAQELVLDIAAIPTALDAESVRTVEALLTAGGPWLHIHQHGYAHLNHQHEGRSCEFGPERNLEEQYNDIAQGQKILSGLFGSQVKPIFTPPWNRCTTETATSLKSLGFSALSRISGSEPLTKELPELNVSIDWLKKRKGVRLSAAQISSLACRSFESSTGQVGVMLHHEHMDSSNRALLLEFVQVLKNAPAVSFASMSNLINR